MKKPRVLKVGIEINNPVMNNPNDSFIDFSLIKKILGVEKAKLIALHLDAYITNTDNWEYLKEEFNCLFLESLFDELGDAEALEKLYVDAYAVFDEIDFVQWFKETGFDGAIHGGSGVSALQTEYKIFNENQANVLETILVKQMI